MHNPLANETSPYLLQHASNPVQWYPWGEDALQKAHREDKPIFLSIGYAACHWCHVMAHESFENEEIAAVLNESFVSIKVDREERPDIDSIYMAAVVAMTGQGGWPMSVFLTPDGEPFFGGTYFPPTPRYGMPSFRDVLESIRQTWKSNREEFFRVSQKLTRHLTESAQWGSTPSRELKLNVLTNCAQTMHVTYDWRGGGWGTAPKFPQPMTIDFLFQQAARGHEQSLKLGLHSLLAMRRGGLYDAAGGGFHRYSTDAAWLVPHFEKMLYDNAQLARAYLHGYQLTGDPALMRTCTETLEFIQRELTDEQGGFYSSLDADSEGSEGKYYLWTLEELRALLPDESFQLAAAAYGLTPQGNFEGKIILRRVADDQPLAQALNLPLETFHQQLDDLHQRLTAHRSQRIRPNTDDKVLVAWNALALHAFAEAGAVLQRPDFLETARHNADFLMRALHPQDRLLRAWRKGTARHNAYLEDYAALIHALLALYEAGGEVRWYQTARNMGAEMVAAFADPAGGFFDTRSDQDALILRPKDLQDNATPSGNALAANALLRLCAYEENPIWRENIHQLLAALQDTVQRYPTAFACWLQAMDFSLGPVQQVALLYPANDPHSAEVYRQAIRSAYRPRLLLAASPYPPPDAAPQLLEQRPLSAGQTTAYICEGFTCQQPVNRIQDFETALARFNSPAKTTAASD